MCTTVPTFSFGFPGALRRDAREKEREAGSERREERAKASRTQRSSSSRRLSLERSNPKRSLSSASSSSRKHSSRLRDVVVAARAVLSVYYRATFITGRFSSSKIESSSTAKRKSKGVKFSRREKHTQRAVLKCNSKTKSFSLSCWSYLPHPPSPRDRGRRE